MALKKENAMLSVKSIKVSQVLPILSLVLFFSACAGKSSNDEVIKALEENLSKSNVAINNSTTTILKALDEKRNNPDYSESRSTEWFERAEKTAETSMRLYNFIAEAKKDVGKKEFSATILHEKLVSYKQEVLSIDSAILEQFNNEFEFVDSFSSPSYSNDLLSRLSMLQNNIKLTENKIIAFCNTKVGVTGDWITSYSAIVGQSSTYVKGGEEITVTAGVGSYSHEALPTINFNGENIKIGEEGFAVYKIKAPKKPGNYSIPVIVDFLNVTIGKYEAKEIKVKYTVAKECN